MSAKNISSDRKRSRPVVKQSKIKKIKRNKPAMALAIIIILMLIFSSVYVIFSNLGESDNTKINTDINNPELQNAIDNSNYPVALLNTTKGLIAVELYDDKAPLTCQNFIKLV
ncbi:MAG: peptidylprolyl isomerase, partial [Thermoplasmatales archaeon]